jgi:ABC-type Fe3+-siderophore transport system permease subunit
VILFVGLFRPTVSARTTSTTEIAIMMITTIVGGVLLTRYMPAAAGPQETREPER